MDQEEEFQPTPLDSLFDEDHPSHNVADESASTADVQDTKETSESEDKSGEKSGEEASTSEAENKSPSPGDETKEDDEQHTVPVRVLVEERQRRKELEKQLSEALGNNDGTQGQEETKKPVSVFEDENAFVANIDEKIALSKTQTRLEVSHAMLAEEHGVDAVNAAFEKFQKLTEDYPQLSKGMRESPHPFKYAMEQVEKFESFDKLQSTDVDAEINKRAEEIAKKMISEMKTDATADDEVPSGLSGENAGGGVASNSWAGPTPLEDIVDHVD